MTFNQTGEVNQAPDHQNWHSTTASYITHYLINWVGRHSPFRCHFVASSSILLCPECRCWRQQTRFTEQGRRRRWFWQWQTRKADRPGRWPSRRWPDTGWWPDTAWWPDTQWWPTCRDRPDSRAGQRRWTRRRFSRIRRFPRIRWFGQILGRHRSRPLSLGMRRH